MPHDFFSFFVCNIEKLIVWRISAKESCYNISKNRRKFQASVTEKCTSLSKCSGIFRQSTWEKVESLKNLYYTWTSSQVIFKICSRIFSTIYLSTYLHKHVCVLYCTCFILVFIFVKGITCRFYSSWDGKRKKNKS